MTLHSTHDQAVSAPPSIPPSSGFAVQEALPEGIELVKEAVTAGGTPYRIGFRASEPPSDAPTDPTTPESDEHTPDTNLVKAATWNKDRAANEGYGIAVDWPVTSDWVATTPEVYKVTSITRYNLKYDPKAFAYNYTLEITNKGSYAFEIYDETGDMYGLGALQPGTHWLWFNSKQPTIKFITRLRFTMLGKFP
ncbi:hypothetical protein FA15DRAFT_707091 [Coprinopsis marcescibilis]|uniref:Uncharacterized protein n=1 Tax=Coprinopsis marcescibilis TaxID=230819 RepID=A0A5C3KNB8_COPMA|nr:hypothetical protein FA15DRAFT_707091 [Coprinopsis marcescibilis]